MKSAIELHDSWVEGITASAGTVVVRFRPAYLHCSEGRPGIDAGSGWLQDIDLIVLGAVLESSFTNIPSQLDDGSLMVGNEVFENGFPFPLDLRGAISFSAVNMKGERFVIQGIQITSVPIGKARYLEQFLSSI